MKNWKAVLLGMAVAASACVAQAQSCRKISGTIRISAVGDILVHKAIYESVMKSRDRFRGLWARLTPQLRDADFTVGNLEGAVAPGTVAGGKNVMDPGFRYDGYVYSGTNFLFNYHPYLLDDLMASGFDFVTTANNHSMDRGALGADRTVDQLNNRNFQFAGSRKRGGADTRARIVQVRSFKIGIISCTESLNGQPDKDNQVLLCNGSAVVNMINNLRQYTNGVIVFPHWGSEYQGKPNPSQRSLAKKWVQAGAAAIIGNHPHVLQTTE